MVIGIVCEIAAVVTAQGFEDTVADRKRSERVPEARMFRGGKGEIGKAELAKPTQALQRLGIDEREFGVVEFDEAMDRVEDPLHGAVCFNAKRLGAGAPLFAQVRLTVEKSQSGH